MIKSEAQKSTSANILGRREYLRTSNQTTSLLNQAGHIQLSKHDTLHALSLSQVSQPLRYERSICTRTNQALREEWDKAQTS
jgi:ABC-type cobalamin transport system ATPase subunit